MPISLAHDIHKKRDPLSEYEKKLAQADDDKRAVLACPYGCGQAGHAELDEFGLCDHVVGFTNCTRPDKSPIHSPDGPVKRPEGAVIELLLNDRDALKRRKMSTQREPLRVGDYLVRVNGTSRRVYRELPTPTPEPERPTGTSEKKPAAKVADAPPG